MNRRSLFRLLTGAAAAVGLGKVWAPKQVVAPLTHFRQFPPASVADIEQSWMTYADGGYLLTQEQRNELVNAFNDALSRDPAFGSRFRIRTPRQHLLDNLDASRDARLTSRFDEGA